MRFFPVLLAVLGTITANAAGPHPSLPPPVIPDCLGVNIHFTDPKPGELEMIVAAGFKWVRMDFGWAATERQKGIYDFSAYDRLVAVLEEHHLHAVFIFDYGNPLYAEPGEKHPFTSRANTDEFRQAFARWAAAGVSHFKGRGFLWEMWNEPNGAGFWKPKPDVSQYGALARATGEALRNAGLLGPKGEAFIGPATSTLDLPFLEGCFKAGLLEFWDGVSVHPYRQTAPDTVAEDYRSLRALITKYGPKGKVIPIISGEWGYSTAWKGHDDALLGTYLPREFLTNVANDVALSIWYDWHDDGTDPKDPEHRFGLVGNAYHAGRDPVYDPKPAYTAMKTLTEQLGGFRFNKELSFGFDQHPLLFTRGEEVRVAFWGISREPAPDWLPASPGTFSAFNYLGEASPGLKVAVHGLTTLELRVGDAPLYLHAEQPNDIWRVAVAWERLPLEVLVEPDQPQTIMQKVHNPLGHVLEVENQAGGTISLQPGEEYSFPVIVPPSRSENILSVFSQGFPKLARLSQQVRYSSRVPLRITPSPAFANRLRVHLQNPTGASFSGQLRIGSFDPKDYPGVEAIEPTSDPVRVDFAKGDREKDVDLPLKHAPRNFYGLNLIFDESGIGQTCHMSSVHRRVMLDTGDSAHAITYGAVADGDPKITANFQVEAAVPATPPPFIDSNAFSFRYQFPAGWKFLSLTRSEIPWPSIDGAPTSFGLWVHGDGKGCQLRARFTDARGQAFQTDGPKADWSGWRFVTFPMRSSSEKLMTHWGGANDGVIRYPIKWMTPLLLDNVSRQAIDGEIYFSAPTLIY